MEKVKADYCIDGTDKKTARSNSKKNGKKHNKNLVYFVCFVV